MWVLIMLYWAGSNQQIVSQEFTTESRCEAAIVKMQTEMKTSCWQFTCVSK